MKKNDSHKKDPDFHNLISRAEKAVVGMKDEQFKKIAFERVLDHLLASEFDSTSTTYKNKTHLKKTLPNSSMKNKQAGGPLGLLKELIEEDFFSQPKSSKQILNEFKNQSHYLKPTDITLPLQKLCHDKLLRRQKIATEEDDRPLWHWVNW